MFFLNFSVNLEKVSRIISGQKTYPFQRWAHIFGPASEKSLSLIYFDETGQERSWDVIAPNGEQFEFWYGSLRSVLRKIKNRREKMSLDDLRLEEYWNKADCDHSGRLSTTEIVNLAASMNVNMPSKTILRLFRQVDVDKSGLLDFEEFIRFMDLLSVRSV